MSLGTELPFLAPPEHSPEGPSPFWLFGFTGNSFGNRSIRFLYSIRPSIFPSWPQIERIWSHLRQTHSHRLLRDRLQDHHRQGLSERRECRAHASAADSRSSRQACCRPSSSLSRSWKLGRDHRRQQGILANCARRAQCDVQRPCTLCLRAGATCSATVRPTVWKNQGPGQRPKSSRPTRESPVELPAAKRPRRATSVENTCMASPAAPTTSPPSVPITPGERGTQSRRGTPRDQIPSSPPEIGSSSWVSSSGAMQFMEEVNCTSVLSS